MPATNLVSKPLYISLCRVAFVVGTLMAPFLRVDGADINAPTASLFDVSTAVAAAHDGDTVKVPAGTATWTSTLNIAKNIALVGAGEGKTIITENLSRSGSPPLISVSLNHDSPASIQYSFRLSGFTFTSQSGSTSLASDHAFITVRGRSAYVASPTAANPAPYVLGCVSRVRLDHLTWNNLNGLSLLVDSCLGVADHITQITTTGRYTSYPIKVFHTNWTPPKRPDNGGPMTTLATNGFGSWADDAYWGTDKFFFFEDCSFTVPDTTNVADNEQGARVVFRHCTFNGGGGLATHGMEGRAQPGIKQQEVYNNYYNVDRVLGQTRSGSILWFNNLLRSAGGNGLPFYTYRQTISFANWGTADGTCRYDNNAGNTAIYTGTVTATDGLSSITDNNQPTFDLINASDGNIYSVNNLNDPFQGPAADPGWRYYHAVISSVNGKTLNLLAQAGGGATAAYRSAKWAVGNHYEIRKVMAAYGQPGQGKGRLLNLGTSGGGSYNTYFWPLTSGAKATYPQAGYPLEPCYAWNNTDLRQGQFGFGDSKNTGLKAGRDYFNQGERTPLATQKVGYPPQDYTRATTNSASLGPAGAAPYTPYTYPHPLASDLSPPTDLQVVAGN
jgi:hypothetical protein